MFLPKSTSNPSCESLPVNQMEGFTSEWVRAAVCIAKMLTSGTTASPLPASEITIHHHILVNISTNLMLLH